MDDGLPAYIPRIRRAHRRPQAAQALPVRPCAAAAGQARMAAMRREAFPVEGPIALVVRAPAGTVEIEAAETSEATVELEAMREGAEGAIESAAVELRPGS